MAVVYDAVVKTARMNATRGEVVAGTLEITTSADAVLVVFDLDTTAGSVTGNVWTLAVDVAEVLAGAAGTAAKARIKNSGGDVRISGLTVGTTGTDVIVSNTNIAEDQPITFVSGTITHAVDPS